MLSTRNKSGAEKETNSAQLPDAPQWKITAKIQRFLIDNFDRFKPKPKNLADAVFIGKVKKHWEKAKKAIKNAEIELIDWQAAEKRYEEIVAYVTAITTWQSASLDKIIEAQGKIEAFQEQLETLLNSLTDKDGELIAKIKKMQETTQELYDSQKVLEKQLDDGKGTPKKKEEETSS